LAQRRKGWKPHPTEKKAQIQSWAGLWHSVLPGEFIKVVVVRRKNLPKGSKKKGVEAFFSTDLSSDEEAILAEFKNRWDVEIDIRDANEFYGLGKNRCRKYERILGANTFCLLLAAARSLWFIQVASKAQSLDLLRFRPWYRQKRKPSQLDIAWACYELLAAEGITPTSRFCQDLQENSQVIDKQQRRAA